jgi:hypothetical protein
MNATRRIKATRVHLKTEEAVKVVRKAAELKLENPDFAWGPLLFEAMKATLPANRWCSENTMKTTGKSKYSKDVLAEIERITAERMVHNVATVASSQEPSANEHEMPQPEVLTQSTSRAMFSIMDQATDFMAEEFKGMLLEKFRKAHLEAVKMYGEELVAGGNPTQFNVLNTEGQKLNITKRIRVALVGNSTDNNYFEKVAKDLHDVYEFIPVARLQDTRRTKDCPIVIMSSSAHNMVQNAVKAIAHGAEVFYGKASSEMHDMLYKRFMNSQLAAS